MLLPRVGPDKLRILPAVTPDRDPTMNADFRSELARQAIDLLEYCTCSPGLWQSPSRLARDLGRDEEAVTDLLAELDLAGWIIVHAEGPEPLISLSPRAAARLGVTPRVSADNDRASWMRLAATEAPKRRSRKRRRRPTEASSNRRAVSSEPIPADRPREQSPAEHAPRDLASAQVRRHSHIAPGSMPAAAPSARNGHSSTACRPCSSNLKARS